MMKPIAGGLLALVFVAASVAGEPEEPEAGPDPQAVRQAALAAGLGSLATVSLPQPNLDQFLNPGNGAKLAARRLGKALFWDMQVGSDGQACGTCHFQAGADPRAKNQMSPGLKNVDPLAQTVFGPTRSDAPGGPNYELSAEDFPFHELEDPEEENFLLRTVLYDSDDVVSSQGVFRSQFAGVVFGDPQDSGTPIDDEVFQVGGTNVRRVEPRNTPTMINAVFNHSNFWDGRAHNGFNGRTVLGPLDGTATILVRVGTRLVETPVAIPNSSLASQAVGPPESDLEMSFFDRSFPLIARKLFSLTPLGLQKVHKQDSLLGPLSRASQGLPGLKTTYPALIKAAFKPRYWSSPQLTAEGATQMEANFALFFGLAVQLYESTLVSDKTAFDEFMEGNDEALEEEQLRGLLAFMRTPDVEDPLFPDDVGTGNCVSCHAGPELTSAAFTTLGPRLIDIAGTSELAFGLLEVGPESAYFDAGFANIGVRGTNEDLGRGGTELGLPLSFTRQALEGLPFAPDLPACGGAGEPLCPIGDRVAVDGAFKVPGLRNVELTGPYFHNGGQATLGQVLEFYDRQSDFGDVNVLDLDPRMAEVELSDLDEEPLIEFLLSLTDQRVRLEKAPFDHPQIFVPNGHPGDHTLLDCISGEQACDDLLEVPAIGKHGRVWQGLLPLGTFLDLPPSDEEEEEEEE